MKKVRVLLEEETQASRHGVPAAGEVAVPIPVDDGQRLRDSEDASRLSDTEKEVVVLAVTEGNLLVDPTFQLKQVKTAEEEGRRISPSSVTMVMPVQTIAASGVRSQAEIWDDSFARFHSSSSSQKATYSPSAIPIPVFLPPASPGLREFATVVMDLFSGSVGRRSARSSTSVWS
jgi:hypothetical protein